MAVDVEIKCINKSDRTDPNERILCIGGIKTDGNRWHLKIEDAIAGIEAGTWQFWTNGGGKPVRVIIATHKCCKYLKTEADGIQPNNLLSLPECP